MRSVPTLSIRWFRLWQHTVLALAIPGAVLAAATISLRLVLAAVIAGGTAGVVRLVVLEQDLR